MKIIFKIFSILLIITVVIFALLLVFANPILERVKPHILSSISTTIGADVQVDAIKSSIFPSPGFSLHGLKVENKEGEDLKVSEVILEVSLIPLFSKKVEIAKVGVRGVRVPIRKLENEDIEVAGINISKKDESSDLNKNEKSLAKEDLKEQAQDKDSSPIDLKVIEAKLSDISVSFKDLKTGAEFILEDLIVDLNRKGEKTFFNLNIKTAKDYIKGSGSFSDDKAQNDIPLFDADLSFMIDSLVPYLAFMPDVKIDGISELGSIPGNLKIKHSKKGELSNINLELLVKVLKEDFNLSTELLNIEKPSVKSKLDIPSLTPQSFLNVFVKENTPIYSGSIKNLSCLIESPDIEKDIDFSCKTDNSEIESVNLSIPSLKGSLKKQSSDVSEFNLHEAKVYLGDGDISLSAKSINTKSRNENAFNANLLISKIQITDLIKLSPPNLRDKNISGVVSNIGTDIKGIAGKKETTVGTFNAVIDNFTIKGYNFFKDILSILDSVPVVGLELSESLPPAYRAILTSENTSFEKLSAKGDIKGETINLSSYLADTKGVHVKGSGKIVKEDLDLDLSLVLENELVSSIEQSKPKISRFKESDGTIVFPANVSKRGDGKPIVTPDVKKIMKQQAGEEIKRRADKVLDKINPSLRSFFK